MGRFYKTASPQMVDFMYKIPEQAILKAIEGTDKQIDTENLYVTESQKLLQKKALNPDDARQVELIKEHQKGIDEVSQLLASSPLAALKDRQKVRDLQKKIYEDVTRGELGAQYKNYDIRQKHLEEETKRATDKDGNIRIEDVNAAMAAFDAAFAKGEIDEQGNVKRPGGTAYDPTTGTYRSYSPEKLVNYFDISEEVKRQAEGWEPDVDTDITRQYLDKSGNYIITDKQGREIIKKDDLTFGLYNLVTTNPEVLNYKNQQIRIRSGAKPGTEEYLKEWERVYGVRQQRGNLGSPFATESIMQTVTDPATGKTETKPLTQKVQKYDEKGNPIEGQFEDKEVKRMVNPGEIFGIAQAQAERKDRNKIVSSITQDETEAYRVGLQQQKEIAVAQAKMNHEAALKAAEKITYSNNNAQNQKVVLEHKTHQEARAALDGLKQNTAKSVSDKGSELINVINNSGKSAKEKERLLNELKAIMTPLEAGAQDLKTLDFSKLKTFLVSNSLAGMGKDDKIGTGIDELSRNYTQSVINYQNKNKHYETLREASKPKDYDELEQEVKDTKTSNDALYAEYLRLERATPNNLRKPEHTRAINAAWNKYQEGKKKLEKVEAKYEEAGKTWGANMNKKLDYNNKTEGRNVNTSTIFSTGGDALRKVLPQSIATSFFNSLSNLNTGQLFPHLLGASNAVAVNKDGQSSATNFNKLLEDNGISVAEFLTLQDGEPIKIANGKMSINLGSARITPGEGIFTIKNKDGQLEQRNIGRGAIQLTLTLYNEKTKKTEVNEIYIPADELTNEALKMGTDYLVKDYKPTDIKNKAKEQFGASEVDLTDSQKQNYYYVFDGGKYYPHTGAWKFDGKEELMYNELGEQYYKEYINR